MYVVARVYPACRKEVVRKISPDTYEIMVREPAQGNRANRRVQAIIADMYDTPIADLKLLIGHRSPKKVFVINRNKSKYP